MKNSPSIASYVGVANRKTVDKKIRKKCDMSPFIERFYGMLPKKLMFNGCGHVVQLSVRLYPEKVFWSPFNDDGKSTFSSQIY